MIFVILDTCSLECMSQITSATNNQLVHEIVALIAYESAKAQASLRKCAVS